VILISTSVLSARPKYREMRCMWYKRDDFNNGPV